MKRYLINFLIGFVLAYMAARSLALFGAHLYVADLVGIGMTRQLGPLMTGIIVCGRSGAAFTAELGTMKVAEEIDALRTLGLQPFDWLVLPRIVAVCGIRRRPSTPPTTVTSAVPLWPDGAVATMSVSPGLAKSTSPSRSTTATIGFV